MKSKVLVSSILTIALCLSLIAGSTFALFTDNSKVNVAITSGDVEVVASVEVLNVLSAEGPVAAHANKYLKDENGHYYEHINPGVVANEKYYFTNGGYATVDADGKLVIDRITPGDKVWTKVTVKNIGDVSMYYRYNIVANNTKLAEGMVVTDHEGNTYEATQSFTSKWFSNDVVLSGETRTFDLAFELPVYAGNEYQSEHKNNVYYDEDGNAFKYAEDELKQVEYVITVEAVQGNAVMEEDVTPYEEIRNVANRDELQNALNDLSEPGKAYLINLTEDIVGDVTISQENGAQFTIDGNGKKYNGVFLVNGKSSETNKASIALQNINFEAADEAALGADAFVRLGNGTTSTRYTDNVTVENCTFTGNGLVAIKSYTGGDRNLTVKKCTVNAGMHSLLQLANVTGVTITGCEINSVRGASVGASTNVVVSNTTFNNSKYCVRYGSSAAINTVLKTFVIENSTLNTTGTADDSAVVFRGNSAYAELTVVDSTVAGYYGMDNVSLIPITNP